MRSVIYNVTIAASFLFCAAYMRMLYGSILGDSTDGLIPALLGYVMLILFFPSCLRLYMFPNSVFDPYTGFAKDDSAIFHRTTSCVRVGSMIVGFIIMLF